MIKLLLVIALLPAASGAGQLSSMPEGASPLPGTDMALDQRPWLEPTKPPSARVAALIAAMTPKEKLVLLQGGLGPGTGNTEAISRFGVPHIALEDGPNGVADWCTEVTTWPSSMTMAASWDPALMQKYGAALGSEQRGKGFQVMLGPGVNLARVPVGGRNFEYLGEDPCLASKMVAAEKRVVFSPEGSYVEDVQTGDVVCPKEQGSIYMIKMMVKAMTKVMELQV